MDLFNKFDPKHDLLPQDGQVYYYHQIVDNKTANHYYWSLLKQIQWKPDTAIIFGKKIQTKREVAWYGEKPFKYTYSKTTKTALIWTPLLIELKTLVESFTKEHYNSCLLNLYHNGQQTMAWHSDGEKDLKENGSIASLSFGAVRKFSFKHKELKIKTSIILEHGSLLEMKGVTQKYWLHRLPPTTKVKTPRINLTFRQIEPSYRLDAHPNF